MAPHRGARGWNPDRLRTLRLGSGVSLEYLAAQINVSVGTLSRWESGVNAPLPRHLKRLASYFEVSTWDFVDISPNMAFLADLRIHAGLNHEDVWKAFEGAGIPKQTYGKLERGVVGATPEQVEVLAELFRKPREEITAAIGRSQGARQRKHNH